MSVQEILDLLSDRLTEDEYAYITQMKIVNPKISFRDLTPSLHKKFRDHLFKYSAPELSVLYYSYMENYYKPLTEVCQYLSSEDGKQTIAHLATNPEAFLHHNCYPFFESRKGKNWSNTEVELMKYIAERAQDSSFLKYLPLCIPGRTGMQCYAKYAELVLAQEITNDVRKIKKKERTMPPLRKYFIKEHEEMLASEILAMFNEHKFISKEIVRQRAKKMYMLPWVLAERAAFQFFIMSDTPIYNENGSYTNEFIRESQILLSQIVPDERRKPLIEMQVKIIEDYRLPDPIFSDTWVRTFMKRNHFSFRLAHYSRRGAIKKTYIDEFIQKVADAVLKYTRKSVYNMDETSVRINNGTLRTIAPVGLEKVIFEGSRSEKECFTAIATITYNEKLPLILLAKGKTDACCSKFRAAKRAEAWPSKNGWVDEQIMIQYLNWLHTECADRKPCALVLDCYKAHRTDAVKEVAKDLGIELIYVPACGTSIYQPLDRRIFGILKAHLRSLAGSRIFYGTQRYETITNHLLIAWARISANARRAGWNIPGLNEELVNRGYDFKQDDNGTNEPNYEADDIEEEDDIDEEEKDALNENLEEEDFNEEEDFDENEIYEDQYY